MTLIIEDGTGKPDAESYASAEDLAMYAVKSPTAHREAETAKAHRG